MADISEVFNTIVDGSDEGKALSEAVEGQAAAGKVGSVGVAFKDSAGNLILPQLTVGGAILVDSGGGGTRLSSTAKVIGSTTEKIVTELTLAQNTTYLEVEYVGACLQTTLWRVVFIADEGGTPVETEIAHFITGSGQFSFTSDLDIAPYLSSGVGVQKLQILAENDKKASDLRGTLCVTEV